jgi:hypothetical protein
MLPTLIPNTEYRYFLYHPTQLRIFYTIWVQIFSTLSNPSSEILQITNLSSYILYIVHRVCIFSVLPNSISDIVYIACKFRYPFTQTEFRYSTFIQHSTKLEFRYSVYYIRNSNILYTTQLAHYAARVWIFCTSPNTIHICTTLQNIQLQ